jgi:hypothetical protein
LVAAWLNQMTLLGGWKNWGHSRIVSGSPAATQQAESPVCLTVFFTNYITHLFSQRCF